MAKTGAECINPYSDSEAKGKQVEQMFDSIAPAYDFMNTAMTFGLHRYWRNAALKAALRALGDLPADARVLDVATGTGDVAFKLNTLLPDAHITGIDLSDGMLSIARQKLSKLDDNARKKISFEQGDSLNLQFDDNTFHLLTVAYGVRNFENLHQGLVEMLRVLKPGGILCIVELSCPNRQPYKFAYNLYSRHIIPAIGRMVSGDSRAYSYLPESIAAAPQREAMTSLLAAAGFTGSAARSGSVAPRWHSLTFGAVTYYLATKPLI